MALAFVPALIVGAALSDFDGNGKSLVADLTTPLVDGITPSSAFAGTPAQSLKEAASIDAAKLELVTKPKPKG